MADTIVSRKIDSLNSLNTTFVSSSTHNYLNYSRRMQGRLAELNNNVSNVIKESCSGIDNICNRVRECLNEMDQRHKTYLMDEITEYDIEEIKLKSCEEISQEIDETVEDISMIGIIEEEKLDTGQSSQNITSLTPFFTEINYNNQDPNNKESCHKRLLNKTIYSLLDRDSIELGESDSRISLDNFKQTMTTLCNNFEMMNKLVENINKEIREFSETALPTVSSSVEKNDSREIKYMSGLKPIKRLSKSNSRQKSVQVGDCSSDINIDFIELNNRHSSSFIIPDVYRKRAFTDLYQKLVAQVEANDSLIFFQSLMNRQKKLQKNKNTISQFKLNIPIMNYSIPKKSVSNISNQIQPPKKTDLTNKYADSLWFSQKNMVRDSSRSNSRKMSKRNVRSKKANNKTVESKSFKSEQGKRLRSPKKKSGVSESNKSLVQGKRLPKTSSGDDIIKRTCSLECTCRMIVQNDMPPSASTKCQLQWLRAKPAHTLQRKLKFLDILDDLTYRDLLPLQSEYPRKDNQHARELDYKDIQDTYLYKLMYGKQSTKNVWKQLLEPSIQCSKVCSSSKTPRSANAKKVKEEKVSESFMEKFCSQNYSKSDILKKLSPYIYDPENTNANYSHSIIVMPVRVYYDNLKTNEPSMKLNNASKPVSALRKALGPSFRDNKWCKQSELSAPKISKPIRVVYDSLPKKQEIQSITASIKPSAMPSKSIINSARSNLEKNSMKKVTSRSFPPKNFAQYCQNAKNSKNDFLHVEQQDNMALYKKIQADIEKIKREIYGKKATPPERKLWAHKYGKSVGQKLISFVDHQKSETDTPVPLYAMPKLEIATTPPAKRNAISFTEKVSPQKQVLTHVKNLKTKNEAIQHNLKKAINVIEKRMVDILSDDSKSVLAFDIMEKEITNVLSLMKCKGKTDLKVIPSQNCDSKEDVGVNTSLEESYDIISENLFERLERILDTGGSSMSNTSIRKPEVIKPQKVKEEPKKKQKISSSRRSKIGIISPSSSASLDEKVINRRSPKGHSKKTENIEVKPKLSAMTTAVITAEPMTTENWENICGDQNSVKNIPLESERETQSEKGTDEEKSQICEYQILRNSSGDFVQPEQVMHKSDVSINNIDTNDTSIDKVISDDKVEKLIIEEKSEVLLDTVSPEQDIDGSNTTVNSIIEDFITEELNRVIDSIVSLAEEAKMEQPQNEPVAVNHNEKENFESSDYNTPQSVPSDADDKMQVDIMDDDANYSEEVHKILKRVENIYCQLDDIQESESIDRIPVFKEKDVSEIHSEIFLTPFMQAVKDNRKNVKQTSKMALVERTPSYYNVISFLDALTNIQKEVPYEVHIAQLHNYVHVYREATVYYQAEIWHEIQYSSSTSSSLRASCLRKSSDETKQIKNKKVSFLQLGKEDKSNQVALCPFHKVKVLRISSQQFPPLESSDEDIYKNICDSNIKHVPESKNDKKTNKKEEIAAQKYCPVHCVTNKHQCLLIENKPRQSVCKIHGHLGKTSETLSSEVGRHIQKQVCCEKTKKSKMSVIGDKSTQVFCQMQIEKKQEENSIVKNTTEENAYLTSNEEQSAHSHKHLQENPDDSKSTDKDFLEDSLLDPFYDYTNESITPKGVMQKIEGIYEEGNTNHVSNLVPTQPKIVVFREVLESTLQPPKSIENVNDIELYKKRLEKRKEMRLLRKSSTEIVKTTISETRNDNENVVLLKSFYAIVYILMFTALSLDYRCI